MKTHLESLWWMWRCLCRRGSEKISNKWSIGNDNSSSIKPALRLRFSLRDWPTGESRSSTSQWVFIGYSCNKIFTLSTPVQASPSESQLLKLNCLDDFNKTSVFKIPYSMLVSSLKGSMKEKKRHAFEHVDSDTLVLRKVDIVKIVRPGCNIRWQEENF